MSLKAVLRFSVLIVLLGGCSRDSSPAPAGPLAPLVHIPISSVDLGRIIVGEDAPAAKFAIENHGTSDLEIRDVDVSCGCLGARIDTDTIKPGQKATLTAKFRSMDGGSRTSGAIHLITNDRVNPRVRLTVTWNAVKPLGASPRSVALAYDRSRDIWEGETRIVAFASMVEAHGFESITTSYPELQSDFIEHGQDGVHRSEGLVTLGRAVFSLPGKSLVQSDFNAVAKLTFSGLKEPVEVPISREAVDEVLLDPQRLFLGIVEKGSVVHKSIRISAGNGEPVILLNHRTRESRVSLDLPADSEQRLSEIAVVVDIPDESGAFKDLLELETDAGMGTVEVTALVQ